MDEVSSDNAISRLGIDDSILIPCCLMTDEKSELEKPVDVDINDYFRRIENFLGLGDLIVSGV